MEEKIQRPKRVLNYESTSLGFLQYVDKLEAYANKLEAKINCKSCKSDSKEFDLFYCAKEKKHPLKRCEEQCGWCEGVK